MPLDIRTVATSIAGFIALAIAGGLISANVRVAASKRGWDTGFDRAVSYIEAAPLVGWLVTRLKSVLAGWDRLQRRWWLWLVLGLSGGIAVASWIIPPNLPPTAQSNFGFNTDPQPAQRQVGETFSIQLAQLLASLPKPCLIRLTGGSSVPTVEQTILWVINYGNVPSGPLCTFVPPNNLPNADYPDPKRTGQPGIVVHWKEGTQAGEKIAHFLGATGLNVSISHEMGQDWPENLVWLDVGNGLPWKP